MKPNKNDLISDWELEAMKQIGIVLSSKDPLIIKLSAIKILIQSTTQRGRELGYAEAKEMALRLSKAQEDLNKLVCGKCKKEGRDEVITAIKESFWVCPAHEEVNPVENKGCKDCAEAAGINVVLVALLKSIKE